MADSKISALTDGVTPANTDSFPAARSGGTTVRLTWAELKAAGSLVQLSDTVLGSNQASFDLTSISQAFTSLKIVCTLRTDESAQFSQALMRFNNDSGSNYDTQAGFGNGSSSASVATSAGSSFNRVIWAGGATSTAGAFGYGEINIPNYTGLVALKGFYSTSSAVGTQGTTTSYLAGTTGGSWRGSAATAISRVTLLPGSGTNFITGSRVTLYGVL